MSKLRLITGLKGSGKSLWAVDQLFKEYEKNPDRPYFSDITGLKHTGIKPAPDDWRDAPDNSLIVYDEVQYKLLFSRHNSKRDTQILDLTTMRKRGIEIWCITQRARFLNADVLGLVDEHVQIERKSSKTSTVYIFQEAEMNITKTKKMFAFDKYIFTHPQDLYGFYESIKDGANHGKRDWVNKGAVSTGMTLIIIICIAAYIFYKTFSGDGIKVSPVGEPKPKPVPESSVSSNPFQPDLTKNETDQKIDLCVKQFGWTPEQCAEVYKPESVQTRNNDLMQSNSNDMQSIVMNYNPSKPYDDYQSQVTYTPTAVPKFSGCMKKGSRYIAYTQQGTILHDVSQSDCRRLLDDNDRPFDYFAAQSQLESNLQGGVTSPVAQSVPDSSFNKQLSPEDLARFQQAKEMGLL